MLILVGVTVTSALNGGLINTAKNAVDRTKSELERENKIASGEAINKYLPPVADDWSQEVIEGMAALELSEDGNYHIKTCAELIKFAEMVNEGNDFEGQTVLLDANLNLQGNNDKQWTPIGNSYLNPFNGTFDGQYHYISEIYISNIDYAGLFGVINDATIKNLGIKSGDIEGISAGGIVANIENKNAVILNCYNEAEITGGQVGGIVGFNYGIIENCYNIGKIFTDDMGGGIVGNASSGTIKKCYNIGTISSISAIQSMGSAGEICGANEEGELLSIEDCYNLGNVAGSVFAGGICGNFSSDGGSIKNCYNIGIVNGTGIVGQIAGVIWAPITNCWYNTDEPTPGIGENAGDVEADTTDESKEYLKGHQFIDNLNDIANRTEKVWKKDTSKINNGYPILSWQ